MGCLLEYSASFPHSLFVLRSPADAEPSGPSSECHLASRKEAGFFYPSMSGAFREVYQVASRETVFSTQYCWDGANQLSLCHCWVSSPSMAVIFLDWNVAGLIEYLLVTNPQHHINLPGSAHL